MKRLNTYSLPEEITNFTTHGLGFIMSLAVCVFFIVKGLVADSWIVLFSLILYLIGVCSSYAASTVYHAIPGSRERAKAIARKFDHAAIYWHIAGSYSPLTLIAMRTGAPAWAWVIFGFVWLCAIVGTITSFRKLKQHSNVETICYVLMGMVVLVAFKPLVNAVSPHAVGWIVGEGVCYITGALFYSFNKRKYMHSVFHFFVLAGSVCHILAVWDILKDYI
jgi:hemolysin III